MSALVHFLEGCRFRLEPLLQCLRQQSSRATAPSPIKDYTSIHVVLGNEASDLDSMACSLVMSYALHQTQPEPKSKLFLPVMNIPRADFPLRTEAACMFARISIREDTLLFLEDVDLPLLAHSGKLSVLLVDHNRLAAHQSFLEPAVAQIIDHHVDEKQCGLAAGDARVIEPVGSCASLVARHVLGLERGAGLLDEAMAELLLGTILVDTVNLDPSKGRTTSVDVDMAELLARSVQTPRDTLFETLRSAKFSLASLTVDELLRKDYKEDLSSRIPFGISSVGMSLWEMARRDCEREPLRSRVDTDQEDLVTRAVSEFMDRKGLHLLIVMSTYYVQESFHRQLAFIHRSDPSLCDKIAQLCRDDAKADLQMAPLPPLSSPVARDPSTAAAQGSTGLPLPFLSFVQGNAAASRKVVLPLVQKIVSAL